MKFNTLNNNIIKKYLHYYTLPETISSKLFLNKPENKHRLSLFLLEIKIKYNPCTFPLTIYYF